VATVANEQYANSLLVEVAGNPLPADVFTLLTYAYVDESRNLPDRFVLRFRDPAHNVLSKGGFTIGAEVKLKVQTSDPGGPAPLITGEVTALECELDRTGSFTEIRGMDQSHRLFHGRRVAAYPNMTVSDIVRKVAQRAGIAVGTVDPVKGVGGNADEQISQDNISDWAFLTRLADLVGAQVMVLDKKLNFRLPQPPSSAPSTSAKATQDPLVLEANRNLISLRAGITATSQVPQAVVSGWDVTGKRAVSASVKPAPPGTEVSGLDAAKLGSTFSAPPYLAADPVLATEGEVRAYATALADRLGGSCVEIDGVAKGNPKLRAGTAVALANVGDPVQGKYTLTSTRHLFSSEVGYTTAFTVSGRTDRSLFGLTNGAAGTAAGPGVGNRPFAGLVPAVISDVKDPKKAGRVKLTLPWLDGQYTTGWARVVQQGAGKDRGLVLLPEVGDEVLVGFSGADLDTAYVIGGLYNGKDTIPKLGTGPVDGSSGEISGRALVSRTGHRLELTEAASGPDGVLLSTGDGKVLLRLDEKGKLVEIISEDKIKITAKNGINVDAGNGPLEMSGQKVSVTSKSDVTVEGQANVSIKGTSGASMEGATVKVTGKASTEVTASGSLTVRGGIVKIN
jgi:phage protein D/phage baseplate assembly protein gpV